MSTPMGTPEPRPVVDRPTVDRRDPDELRADLEQQRRELGETVEELVHRVDVPARARERRDEAVAQVRRYADRTTDAVAQRARQASGQARRQAARAGDVLHDRAPGFERAVRERSAALLAVAAALTLVTLIRSGRRRRARRVERG